MREIKVRAWDTKRKEWVKDFSISKNGSILCSGDSGNLLYEGVHKTKLELVEFTGLKDKNSKDIYEGDIARERKSIGQIKHECERFFIDWFSSPESYNDTLRWHNNNLEIIGNIYENPKLLREVP